jgi:hypothetical protein
MEAKVRLGMSGKRFRFKANAQRSTFDAQRSSDEEPTHRCT